MIKIRIHQNGLNKPGIHEMPDNENVMEDDESPFKVSDNERQSVGTYVFTDCIGKFWELKLDADCSATLKHNKDVYYASWHNYSKSDSPYFCFDYEMCPCVMFPSGAKNVWYPMIIGKYFYYDSIAAKAKNPMKRLEIKKIY
jgi:hypothetical protein